VEPGTRSASTLLPLSWRDSTFARVPHISIPADVPGIRGLFSVHPEIAGPIADLTQQLLYAPNSLTRGYRELIGAHVSALNDCTFCRTSHAAIAVCHLDDEALVEAAVRDPDTAPIPEKLKALLAIAGAVQRGGQAVTTGHIDRARVAGATDVEIHDTVLIAAAFCMFNRYVDGLAAWTPSDPAGYRDRARHVAEHGYAVAAPGTPPSGR
jgi:uncharacterized peroxidase-related enzyme